MHRGSETNVAVSPGDREERQTDAHLMGHDSLKDVVKNLSISKWIASSLRFTQFTSRVLVSYSLWLSPEVRSLFWPRDASAEPLLPPYIPCLWHHLPEPCLEEPRGSVECQCSDVSALLVAIKGAIRDPDR